MVHNEKRANSRITVREDVTLVVPGMDDRELCVLENISMGGVKFYSSLKLAVGRRVEFRVPSPEEAPEIIIQAKILRLGAGDYKKPFGYACVIEHIEND